MTVNMNTEKHVQGGRHSEKKNVSFHVLEKQ